MARAAGGTIGVEDKESGAREPPPVAETRDRLSRAFGYVEDVVYIGLAVVLAATALVLLGTSALSFWRHVAAGTLTPNIVGLLDQLLLVLMVVEILYTVQVSFREHVLTAPPFLLVALIAVVRRIVVLTAETP
ncbi:MAG: phosphate-starvation-inducible PsiE family protein, partial [Candidatus Rokubacteria bacterium]|nr:phosphate-starvation-inducible PsiE family protein [Candidatus Rokubacteria bacterium]